MKTFLLIGKDIITVMSHGVASSHLPVWIGHFNCSLMCTAGGQEQFVRWNSSEMTLSTKDCLHRV